VADRLLQANDAPRLGPRGARRFTQALLASAVAVPALSALYGFRGQGGAGAAGGAVAGLVAWAIAVWPFITLRAWLTAPRQPPLWRHERLYWSVTATIGAAILVAGVILIGVFDPVEAHSLDGWVHGLILGAIAAWLFVVLAARLHAWLMWLRGPQPALRSDAPSRLQDALSPILTELEAVRQDAGRHIRRRAAGLAPAGALLGLTGWAVYAVHDADFNLLLLPVAVVAGGLTGHLIAASRLAAEYGRLYKARVLPALAGLLGDLTFQRPPPPDLARLRRFHVFRHFDTARADDAIVGVRRGLKISIVQLVLKRTLRLKPVFHGLLIELELHNRLTGVTALSADAGALGNLRDALATPHLERVGLESAEFEREYEVYATDQVMARALVTPDFMERLLALGRRPGLGRPLALAQDNLLVLALPVLDKEGHPENLFQPPNYEAPAAADEVLGRLYRDIEAVLGAADAVIALDSATGAQGLAAKASTTPFRRHRNR